MSGNFPVQPRHSQDRGDELVRFFQSPVFLSITIGIPFCIFKFLFGALAIRIGSGSEPLLVTAGGIIIFWAGLDLLMNITRAGLDVIGKGDRIEFCSLAQAGRSYGKQRIFLAIDTLLSFSIICITLWSSWITLLTPRELFLWYFATTLNLISLSLVILYAEIRREKYPHE